MIGARGSFADHYTTGAFAPYIRERRLAGSAAHMLEAAQPAGDFSDPPTTDLVLTVAMSAASGEFDFGPGRFSKTFASGQMVLTSPGVATTILIDRPHRVRFLAVPAEHLGPYLKETRVTDGFDFGRLQVGAFENQFILEMMNRLWAEAEQDDGVSRLFADGAILAVAAELLREAGRSAVHARGGLAAWQVRRVTDYMRANLARDIPLSEPRGVSGLIPPPLLPRLQAVDRRLPARLVHAAPHRTGAGDHRGRSSTGLTEVALCVGFGSQSAFGTAFRRVTGTSPSAWRRKRLS
jgi:AraC family transcriptional regulator